MLQRGLYPFFIVANPLEVSHENPFLKLGTAPSLLHPPAAKTAHMRCRACLAPHKEVNSRQSPLENKQPGPFWQGSFRFYPGARAQEIPVRAMCRPRSSIPRPLPWPEMRAVRNQMHTALIRFRPKIVNGVLCGRFRSYVKPSSCSILRRLLPWRNDTCDTESANWICLKQAREICFSALYDLP